MSKNENYNKNMYQSIAAGIRTLMEPYQVDKETSLVYTAQALEEVLAFLCFNDIPHGYCKSGCGEQVVSVTLTWDETKGERTMRWFEVGSNNEQWYLLEYSDCYCGEFDVTGFMILDSEGMKEWTDAICEVNSNFKRGREFSFFFSENEYISYNDFKDFISCFSLSKISIEFKEIMEKVLTLSNGCYGIMPCHGSLQDWIEDNRDMEESNEVC
jgi:hypothetical protein